MGGPPGRPYAPRPKVEGWRVIKCKGYILCEKWTTEKIYGIVVAKEARYFRTIRAENGWRREKGKGVKGLNSAGKILFLLSFRL
jgi:hypothetical protein